MSFCISKLKEPKGSQLCYNNYVVTAVNLGWWRGSLRILGTYLLATGVRDKLIGTTTGA